MTAALTSWRDAPAKHAIVDVVASATEAGAGFIPAADRIATFDNDCTLWVERPMPPQFNCVFRRWAAEAEAVPSLAGQQPYEAIIGEGRGVLRGGGDAGPRGRFDFA